MKIQSIHPASTNKTLYINKNNINNTQQMPNSKPITFNGIGAFFNTLNKKPIKAHLPEEVLKKLAEKESGAYILTKKATCP